MERSVGAEHGNASGERLALSAAPSSPAPRADLPGAAAHAPAAAELLPGRFDPRFAGGFGWYVGRLFRKRFHAVRILSGDLAHFAALEAAAAPAVVAINHPGWWDPLVAFLLARRLLPTRTTAAPMDLAQLRRFGFFRRIGVFGIDPDDPRSAAAMAAHVEALFRDQPRTALWITPQGRFTDVRESLRIRPGAALVAARAAGQPHGVNALAVAIEYAFWQDQRPEVFVAATAVASARNASTVDWHRAIAAALGDAQRRLAGAVVARDPAPFVALVGGESARINPIFDLWLRLRGRHGAIDARRGPSP